MEIKEGSASPAPRWWQRYSRSMQRHPMRKQRAYASSEDSLENWSPVRYLPREGRRAHQPQAGWGWLLGRRPCTQRHSHRAESWSSPCRLELSHCLLPRLSVLYIWADVLPLHWVHGEHIQHVCPLAGNASTSGEANGQHRPALFVAPLLLQAVQGDGACGRKLPGTSKPRLCRCAVLPVSEHHTDG